MRDCKVIVLGTEYAIRKDNFNSPELKDKNCAGYCFYDERLIVYEDLDTDDDWKNEGKDAKEKREKHILRHELFHAFLHKSGLSHSTFGHDAWAVNEEMVDWFAIQSPKIFSVFKELNLL